MFASIIAIATAVGAAQAPPSWGQACTSYESFWPDTCPSRFGNAYQRGLCEVAQEKARKESYVVVEGVRTKSTYNAKRERFEVEVPSLFRKDIRLADCGGSPCVSRVIVGRYLTWPIKTKLLAPKLSEIDRGASKLERVFTRFSVPLMDVPNPREFERDLRVDVLIKVVRASTARDPGKLVAHAIYGVPAGIVARVQGGGWSKELRKAPKRVKCVMPRALGSGNVAQRPPSVAVKTPVIAAKPVDPKTPGTKVAKNPDPPKKAVKPRRSLTKEQVGATIDHHAAAIQVCYRKQLGVEPDLEGKLTFQFTIRPDGATVGVKETARSLDSDNVSTCVAGVLRGMLFPEFDGESVTIVYPFEFGS